MLSAGTRTECLFLSGHLLLDFPPGANFEAPANPAKWLGSYTCGVCPTYRAPDGFLQAGIYRSIRGDRLFCLLQDLRRDHRLRPWLRFASHKEQSCFNIANNRLGNKSAKEITRTKRPPEPVLIQLHRATRRNGGNAGPGLRAAPCRGNRFPPERCACKSGNEPGPGYGHW